MMGSKNNFFKQDLATLEQKRSDVATLLKIKGYYDHQIEVYLKAFDYFIKNSEEYDGATIVKDLQDIPHLDLDAMLHDYHYLVSNVAANFYTKWYADWLYAKGQERKGKGQYSSFSRFLGLTIIGIGFVPYANYIRGDISIKQKIDFFKNYEALMN